MVSLVAFVDCGGQGSARTKVSLGMADVLMPPCPLESGDIINIRMCFAVENVRPALTDLSNWDSVPWRSQQILLETSFSWLGVEASVSKPLELPFDVDLGDEGGKGHL